MAQKKGVEPQQDRGIEAKRQILAAAVEEFAEHGFDRATTRSIARRCGENPAMIRYYFGGKEHLWKAAMDALFSQFLGQIVRSYAEYSGLPVEQLPLKMLHALVRGAAAYPAVLQILVMENLRNTSRLKWLVDTHIRPGYDLFRSIYRELDPLLRSGSALDIHVFYAFIGASSLIFASKEEARMLSGRDDLASDAAIAHHADLLYRLFFNAPVSSTAPRRSRSRPQAPKRKR